MRLQSRNENSRWVDRKLPSELGYCHLGTGGGPMVGESTHTQEESTLSAWGWRPGRGRLDCGGDQVCRFEDKKLKKLIVSDSLFLHEASEAFTASEGQA